MSNGDGYNLDLSSSQQYGASIIANGSDLANRFTRIGGRTPQSPGNKAFQQAYVTGANAVATALGGPGAGAAAGAFAQFITSFFSGADPRQVPASQIEQAYEAAADNMFLLALNGMISPQQAKDGMDALIQSVTSAELQARLGPASQKGIINATKVISDEQRSVDINVANGRISPTVTQEISKSAARKYYLTQKPGWYPDSITSAGVITDEFLSSLPPNFVGGINVSAFAGPSVAAVTSGVKSVAPGVAASLLSVTRAAGLPSWVAPVAVIALGALAIYLVIR